MKIRTLHSRANASEKRGLSLVNQLRGWRRPSPAGWWSWGPPGWGPPLPCTRREGWVLPPEHARSPGSRGEQPGGVPQAAPAPRRGHPNASSGTGGHRGAPRKALENGRIWQSHSLPGLPRLVPAPNAVAYGSQGPGRKNLHWGNKTSREKQRRGQAGPPHPAGQTSRGSTQRGPGPSLSTAGKAAGRRLGLRQSPGTRHGDGTSQGRRTLPAQGWGP